MKLVKSTILLIQNIHKHLAQKSRERVKLADTTLRERAVALVVEAAMKTKAAIGGVY